MMISEEKSKAVSHDWEWEAHKALSDLIGEVPYGLERQLGLKSIYEMSDEKRSSNRDQESSSDARIRDLREAMHICEQSRKKITEVYKILDEIEQRNDRMMADLRNNYPTPYDSVKFVDAWRYAHKNHARLTSWFEDVEYTAQAKKAYEKFCEMFYQYFGGVNDAMCHIKTFIQADDQRYGEIEFYVDGIVGDFLLHLPLNHILEYGNSPCGSMKMSVSYSAPDCAGYSTGNYKTVAESYDMEELAIMFKSAIEVKKGLNCELRAMDYYIALVENQRKDVEDYCAKNDKTYEEFVEKMKVSIMKTTTGKED